jgi:hypothetical protein
MLPTSIVPPAPEPPGRPALRMPIANGRSKPGASMFGNSPEPWVSAGNGLFHAPFAFESTPRMPAFFAASWLMSCTMRG